MRFVGAAPPDPDDPHPPGAGIARAIEVALLTRGGAVEPTDNWQDVGWIVGYGEGQGALDISLAAIGSQQWMLQVAPLHVPGFLARLTGRRAPDHRQAIHQLAREVSSVLAALGMHDICWRWDGPPSDSDPSEPPTAS